MKGPTMAERINEEDFPGWKRGRQGVFNRNWDELLDGSVWKLTLEEDFPGCKNLKNVRSAIGMAAKKRGLHLRTSTYDDKFLFIQAYSVNGETDA